MNTQQLKELARRATGGIWKAFINEKTNTFAIHTPDDARCGNIVDWMGFDGVDCSKKQKAHNARFIAASNPAAVIELIERLESAERERDELRAEQAEHDEQIARMEGKFSLAKRALDSKTARCEKAEAELRRRDAAAGEPDYWQFKSVNGDWIGISESAMRQAASEGVELPDHKFRECVNGLLEEAIAYAGTQQLRARLSSRLSNFVKPQHAASVPDE